MSIRTFCLVILLGGVMLFCLNGMTVHVAHPLLFLVCAFVAFVLVT